MYLYISIYILYIYLKIYLFLKKNATFCVFLQKNETFRVLLHSWQKNKTFSAFFNVLCKRTLRSLHSFTFLRKERKRMHPSFGSHKSPKCKRTLHALKERKRTMHSERKKMRCPTLLKCAPLSV